MQSDSPYSPVLWGAIFIPIISGTELFIDPATRSSYGLFVLGFFYLASIRYTLAVGLGVYSHEASLKNLRTTRSGAILWFCYFMVLLLCSLLVPGAAIFGLIITVFLTMIILGLSITQGVISRHSFSGQEKSDITWRVFVDILLLALLIYESFFNPEQSFQSTFFTVIILFLADFTISEFAKSTLKDMYGALRGYLQDSWNGTNSEKSHNK